MGQIPRSIERISSEINALMQRNSNYMYTRYFALRGVRSIVMSRPMFVGLFVRLSTSITRKLHGRTSPNFFACCLRHWRNPVMSVFVCVCVCLSVCLSARIFLGQHVETSPKFLCMLSVVAVARSSSGGVAIRYVLPILWMTSCFPLMGPMAS